MTARAWFKLWAGLLAKPKVRREIRDHGANAVWVWICCILAAGPGEGRLILSDGEPMTIDDLADLTSLPPTEVERCVAILLRWGQSSPGRWLGKDETTFVVRNFAGRQETPDAARKRQARERTTSRPPNDARTVRGQSSDNRADRPQEAEAEAEGETDLIPVAEATGGCGHHGGKANLAKPSGQVPIDSIVDRYNELCVPAGCPKCLKVADAWRSNIRKRWAECAPKPEVAFEALFQRVAASAFLTGKAHTSPGRRPFRASLDWVMRPENFAKIVNGNYDVQIDGLGEYVRKHSDEFADFFNPKTSKGGHDETD